MDLIKTQPFFWGGLNEQTELYQLIGSTVFAKSHFHIKTPYETMVFLG